MEPSKIIALQEGTREAGAIVWWRLSGEASRDALVQSLTSRGIDTAPAPVSGIVALRRAMRKHSGPRRLLRPVSYGVWRLVDEKVDDGKLEWRPIIGAELADEDGTMVEVFALHDDVPDALVTSVEAAFNHNRNVLAQNDCSVWLSRTIVHKLNAVSLRDTGGIYFVPKGSLEGWHAIRDAMRESTQHVMAEVPALHSDEAVAAIVDAIAHEAETLTTFIENKLTDDELGAKALHSQSAKLQDMATKVAAYESLLGTSMDILREKLTKLDAQVAAAAILAAED